MQRETGVRHLLCGDHALAYLVLTELEEIAAAARADLPVDGPRLLLVLRFFSEFLETTHQQLEHEVLFPAVFHHGDATEIEFAGRLTAEHDESRLLLRMLALAAEPAGPIALAERETFHDLATIYAQRMREHMATEERVLFPFADSLELDPPQRRAHAATQAVWRARMQRTR